jgi:GntR family transcriptional regulator, transcriptional repressor for pyruvate dehydrogenase complex
MGIPASRATAVERLLGTRQHRRTAVDDIVGRIGISVDLGLLKPLERLPSNVELARAFGVAPITIRRALARLAEQGVVTQRRGRAGGTFVAEDPPRNVLLEYERERAQLSADIWELLEHRRVLEVGAAYMAARRASREDVKELRALVEEMDAAEDWAAFRLLDTAFHLTLARLAGSERVVRELTSLLAEVSTLYFPFPIEYLRASNRQHADITDAIGRGDAEAACVAVELQVDETRRSFSWMEGDRA